VLNAEVIFNSVQSIGVIAALAFAGYELYQRNREQKFRNYLDYMGVFFDATKLLVENKDLHPLYSYSLADLPAASYDELSPEQRSRVHYCDVVIGLCETVWVANQEGWLDKTEWPYTQMWLLQLGQSPDFRWTVDWVTGDYSEDFMREVRLQIVEGKKRLQASTAA
jgi:hypothetical protein